jgi:hypothetical protein
MGRRNAHLDFYFTCKCGGFSGPMTGKQDKGARRKINADNDPRSRVSLLNLANHHPQLLILISIQLSSTAETAHAVRCCLALLQVLHSGLLLL